MNPSHFRGSQGRLELKEVGARVVELSTSQRMQFLVREFQARRKLRPGSLQTCLWPKEHDINRMARAVMSRGTTGKPVFYGRRVRATLYAESSWYPCVQVLSVLM